MKELEELEEKVKEDVEEFVEENLMVKPYYTNFQVEKDRGDGTTYIQLDIEFVEKRG